jgi:hypothetical protein
MARMYDRTIRFQKVVFLLLWWLSTVYYAVRLTQGLIWSNDYLQMDSQHLLRFAQVNEDWII